MIINFAKNSKKINLPIISVQSTITGKYGSWLLRFYPYYENVVKLVILGLLLLYSFWTGYSQTILSRPYGPSFNINEGKPLPPAQRGMLTVTICINATTNYFINIVLFSMLFLCVSRINCFSCNGRLNRPVFFIIVIRYDQAYDSTQDELFVPVNQWFSPAQVTIGKYFGLSIVRIVAVQILVSRNYWPNLSKSGATALI